MFKNILQLGQILDYTLLSPITNRQEIEKACQNAIRYRFAALCVPPAYVEEASRYLVNTPVKVSTVVGFPLGHTSIAVKIVEAMEAVKHGAQELEIMINIGLFKAGEDDYILTEIRNIINVTPKNLHKIIIETGCLTSEEKVRACHLILKSGADYVKTSTGFGFPGATVADVKLLKSTLGPKGKVKASGGIRDLKTVHALWKAGASRIGTSAAVAIMEEYQRSLAKRDTEAGP